jgi:hypothetical protein
MMDSHGSFMPSRFLCLSFFLAVSKVTSPAERANKQVSSAHCPEITPAAKTFLRTSFLEIPLTTLRAGHNLHRRISSFDSTDHLLQSLAPNVSYADSAFGTELRDEFLGPYGVAFFAGDGSE